MKHIRGFDGLRALAVLGVMAVHLHWQPFNYGWVGVTLFFVLSGFLITGILLDNKGADAKTFFTAFYVRRCLRIFPLYFLYLAVVAALYAYLNVWTSDWLWYLTYLQNFYLGVVKFQITPWMPLLHTWSLAVEEQFYLMWPLVVFLVPTRALKWLAWTLIAFALASHSLFVQYTDYWSFAFITSNFTTLCLGAYLAILYRENQRSFRRFSFAALGVGTLAVLAINVWQFVSRDAYQPVFTFALTVMFAGIIGTVAAVQKSTILEWKPLAYLGRISYGLYIWHPLAYALIDIAIYHKWMPDMAWAYKDALRVAIAFALAIMSYHAFELPLLRLKGKFTYTSKGERTQLENAPV